MGAALLLCRQGARGRLLGRRADPSAHAGPGASVTEASVGVRFAGTERGFYAEPLSVAGDSRVPDKEGVAAIVRLGLSTAPPGGAGLFLDSGWDFMVRNPDQYGLVPIRLGIQFP